MLMVVSFPPSPARANSLTLKVLILLWRLRLPLIIVWNVGRQRKKQFVLFSWMGAGWYLYLKLHF